MEEGQRVDGRGGGAAFQDVTVGSRWHRRCYWKSSREHGGTRRHECIEMLGK